MDILDTKLSVFITSRENLSDTNFHGKNENSNTNLRNIRIDFTFIIKFYKSNMNLNLKQSNQLFHLHFLLYSH